MNIHLDNEKVEAKSDQIKKFLTDKLTKKILDKGTGLFAEYHFHIIPVIWGGWQDIKVYSDFFIEHKLGIDNVFEPISYVSFIGENGYYGHRFRAVSNIFT